MAKKPKARFVYINKCNCCDCKWDSKEFSFECPRCNYVEPEILDDKKLKIIVRRKVKVDDNGRIICHIKPREEN
jgi:Zn finger protein HypA/HybF involved in hydrogenase expression